MCSENCRPDPVREKKIEQEQILLIWNAEHWLNSKSVLYF